MHITLHGGGLKNGKNGGEPNGFCLVFVMRKNNFEILRNLRKGAPLSFLISFGRFPFINSAIFIHSPYKTGSQPMSGRYYMLSFHMLFQIRIQYNKYNLHSQYVYSIMFSTAISVWDHRILLDFFCVTNIV